MRNLISMLESKTHISTHQFTVSSINRFGENQLFISWILREREIKRLFQWFKTEVKFRFLVKVSSRLSLYPSEIKATAGAPRNFTIDKNIVIDLDSTACQSKAPRRIPLAGRYFDVNSDVLNWQSKFSDNEDEESLHRWNWVLHLASRREPNVESLNWALLQLEHWITHFQHEVRLRPRELDRLPRWESYTISERLSNSCILFDAAGVIPSKRLVKAVIAQAELLSLRMEYRGEKTSNHIINNARGLYLVGVFFQINLLRKLSKEVLMREMPLLISPNGFVREGSSHYQLLISRWILEIRHFSRNYNDEELTEVLNVICAKLIEGCNFFLVENETSKTWSFPLFGDISPDCSPEWLANLPHSALVKDGTKNTLRRRLPENSWNWIWENRIPLE